MFTAPDQFWALRHLQTARNLIYEADTIAISGHANPDGDSIGAMLSLGLGLELLGKRVYMLCTDNIPRNYQRLPGANRIVKAVLHPVDLAIAVDCGSKEMLGSAYAIFEKAGSIVEIDHHHARTGFGDVSLVDPEASSAGELVYTLLEDMEIVPTRDIAQNILTSIIVETNSFRLPGIRPRTFQICAALLNSGVDFYELSEAVYWVTSRATALLSGICLSKCQFDLDGTLAWSVLTRRDLDKVGASDSDADPVAEKLRSIQGVNIAILFREKNAKEWRVSFRSKGGIDVSRLAEQFGGGGHLNAAGCTIPRRNKLRQELLQCARDILGLYRSNIALEFCPPAATSSHGEATRAIALRNPEAPGAAVAQQTWEHDEPIFAKQLTQRVAS